MLHAQNVLCLLITIFCNGVTFVSAFSLRGATKALTGANATQILVITVPGLEWSVNRMGRLGKRLTEMGLQYEEVHGPNMEDYCPYNSSNYSQSNEAARQLLAAEWNVEHRNPEDCKLALFQMATLIGHARAWEKIALAGSPAVILEDDAEVSSADALQSDIAEALKVGADVALLDTRHCLEDLPRAVDDDYDVDVDDIDDGDVADTLRPSLQAAGLAGYWLDSKAADIFVHFPLDIPVDWGVNAPMRNKLHAVCTHNGPVSEYGGEPYARTHSSAHGCGGQHGVHPVTALLASLRTSA